VTDPAGKWKKFTMDAFGNLSQVQEPDPSLGTVTTSYTYDILNHLTNVSMPRGTTTQQRSFNYIDPASNAPGAFLRSATNPENGTVTYTYNTNNLLSTKTDAKNQVLTYTYDTYNRLYQVLSGSTVLRTFYYDTNTLDGSHTFTQNGTGRLVAIQYPSSPAGAFAEWFSYTQPGRMATKRLQITGANLDASYTYDNEGKTATVQYPNSGPKYTYAFDLMHRASTLTDQNNNQVVSAVNYGPSNELQSMMRLATVFGPLRQFVLAHL
jgi:YD repeat-containing protein